MEDIRKYYSSKVKAELQSKFQYNNSMKIPSLKKVVISMGVAEAAKDKNAMQDHINELTLLSGQKPIVTRAKKAVSNFKLKEKQRIN